MCSYVLDPPVPSGETRCSCSSFGNPGCSGHGGLIHISFDIWLYKFYDSRGIATYMDVELQTIY